MIIFDLNKKEEKSYKKFLNKLSKKYKNKKIEFIFSQNSGIGTSIKVKIGKKRKDITDYKSW